eukprot:NODE_16713_length_981_cov_6.271663.p1 GENE.NODE_16713_length_981_cov_6.271663~~NODE_16713_length_981_cov_6.271663.p1  ORF type:complete len:219 (-),score=62.04 NODE_16713_length_981_cov_6.271663:227-883(-)
MGVPSRTARARARARMGNARGSAAQATAAPPEASGSCSSSAAAAPKQFTPDEAVGLLRAIKDAFSKESFQKLRRHAEAQHPQRRDPLHPDSQAFMSRVYGLQLHVYRTVLPRPPWNLEPSWPGYQQMEERMVSASKDGRVAQLRTEINLMLGLPRHFVIKPPPEDPVIIAATDGSGGTGMPVLPQFADEDGDVAHEFWQEAPDGSLQCVPLPLPAFAE